MRDVEDAQESRFYEHVLETIDWRLYTEFCAKHGVADQKSWLDLPGYLSEAYRRVKMLQINNGKPMRALDLACGPGYVSYTCRYFGHDAIGLDKPGREIFSDIDRLLNGERITVTIRPVKPLPDTRRFNVVTAFNASFHTKGTKRRAELWDLDDWTFFFEDLTRNHLTDDGKIHFILNNLASSPGLNVYGEEFADFITANGGIITEITWNRGLVPAKLITFDNISKCGFVR